MKYLIPALILAFALAFGVYLLTEIDPGYVRISVGHWLIETNLIVLGVLILLLFVLAQILVKLFRRFAATRSFFGAFFHQRRLRRMREQSSQGMLAYLEGDWLRAKKLLSRSADDAEAPLLNYLAAARAANELGQTRDAEELIKRAYDCSQASEFAIGIAEAQLQLEEQELDKALATLQHLRKLQPEHPLVLKLLRAAYLKREDWQQLAQLIPALRKLPKSNREALDELEVKAWLHLFARTTEQLSKHHSRGEPEASEALAELWRKVPDKLRFDARLIGAYARELMQLGFDQESEALLRKTLNQEWDESLAHFYGLVEGKDVREQLLTAERWYKNHSDSPALLLCLGRLALRNELWGKALEYFEHSNRLQPSIENYAELCRLSSRLDPDARALRKWNDGLVRTLKLPALPLPEID